jgi:hypothetical protein
MAYTTTMSTLLTAIKTRLQAQSGLSGIKTWKRGILPPLPVFPALAILPMQEVLFQPMSDGTYWVDRTLRLDVWMKRYESTEKALTDAMNLMATVKTAIRTEYEWPVSGVAQCTETLYGEEEIGEGRDWGKATFVQPVMLELTCRSKEAYPTVTVTKTTQEVATRPFVDHVVSVLDGYRSTTLAALRAPVTGHTILPIATRRFPVITVTEDTERLTHDYAAGIDAANRELVIHVFTQLLDKETMLNDNLSLVEAVKDICQSTYAWGGRCVTSEITQIRYGQDLDAMLYHTTLTLACVGVDML